MSITGRVLIVDDDGAVRRAYKRMLEAMSATVSVAESGAEAIECMTREPFDVVLSDITMPKMNGLEFLRAVRERDLDVPVILITGNPGLETAMSAVEYGAFRYLIKPVESSELEAALVQAMRMHRLARLKREALELAGAEGKRLGDRATVDARLGLALTNLWVAFQPIVTKDHRLFGYEALLRSSEPTMSTPSEVLDAAERVGRVLELGRLVRSCVAREVTAAPNVECVFVNLHALDLNDDELYQATSPLARIAQRVVLEITERAPLDGVHDVIGRVAKLREMGYRIAIDDLGAGYAGLSSFTQIEPEVVKLDMSLVRGIGEDPRKASVVRSLLELSHELDMIVVAEGIETVPERDMLLKLGADLFQGFLYAKPGRGFLPWKHRP